MSHAAAAALDTEPRARENALSAGDGPRSADKPRELNNNEVDALSRELSDMGCIVDAARSPPACTETAVEAEGSTGRSEHPDGASEEDAYLSEVFEASDSEEPSPTAPPPPKLPPHTRSAASTVRPSRASGDSRSTSRYGECERDHNSRRTRRRSRRRRRDVSPYSKRLGSQSSLSRLCNTYSRSPQRFTRFHVECSKRRLLPVPQTRRINMSFTNDRLRDIERENRILLDKILSARSSKRTTIPPSAPPQRHRPAPPPAPAALARRQLQRRIDRDNMILLRKIERASSSSCSRR